MAFAAVLLTFAPASRPQTSDQSVSLDDKLIYDGPNQGDIPKPDCIEIAPMAQSGSPVAGTWTGVSDSIFSAILARTGIIPGQTDPDFLAPRPEVGLPARPGFIDLISNSGVLNPSTAATDTAPASTSKRATFGYFVRITQAIRGKPVTREFFLLMSYDYIDQGVPGRNPAAFEVFIFGPMPTPGMYGGGDPTALLPLQDGLAVNGDGMTLEAVPANIALVNNYRGNKVPPNTQVTPGVEPGMGCFQCHEDRKGDFPDSTGPFPWTATFGDFTNALPSHTLAQGGSTCPPPPSAAGFANAPVSDTGGVLQGGVLTGIGVTPPAAGQPNRGAEEGGSEGSSGGGKTHSEPQTGAPR